LCLATLAGLGHAVDKFFDDFHLTGGPDDELWPEVVF
jgi:hypothetical protein